VLKFPGGTEGPAFLMMKNFYVLKRYNNADKYALAVGHLADRIAGGGPIIQTWPRGYIPLDDEERIEAQKHLLRLGFYDGEIDGNIGSGSRKAILDFQKSKGMTPDGFPSRKVLDKLRTS
jgi:membrane-bound lytic murein transglycosylase B